MHSSVSHLVVITALAKAVNRGDSGDQSAPSAEKKISRSFFSYLDGLSALHCRCFLVSLQSVTASHSRRGKLCGKLLAIAHAYTN